VHPWHSPSGTRDRDPGRVLCLEYFEGGVLSPFLNNFNGLVIFHQIVISHQVKIFPIVMHIEKSTIRLLNSSTVVAISGGLRLHIAFLLAGIAPQIFEYTAFALIVYATYTLDRSLDCKEDAVNRCELAGANKNTGMLACIASFLLGAGILMHDGLYVAPFFPFIVGYVYTHGIRIGTFSLRFKAGLGVKNAIIGITWGGTMALIVSQWCTSPLTVSVIFLFFSMKVFMTSCVNDFKDIRGDMAAGIRTLPVYLGENLTKKVLIMILLGSYGVMLYALLHAVIRDEWILLTCGFFITLGFLLTYTPSFEEHSRLVYRKMREFAISWESAVGLVIRACVPV
jgi:4-hydroxybenzoate polyprenyltransferase